MERFADPKRQGSFFLGTLISLQPVAVPFFYTNKPAVPFFRHENRMPLIFLAQDIKHAKYPGHGDK